jgi:predicted HicB family RNase H-like nuclease
MKNNNQETQLTTLTVRVEREVREKLAILASLDKRHLSNYVRLVLCQHVEANQHQNKQKAAA